MSSETKPERLVHPMAGVNEDMQTTKVVRYPLVYEQSPVTDYNYARLPEQSQWEGMEIAYRERAMTDTARRSFAVKLFLWSAWTAAILTGFLTILSAAAQFMGFGEVVGAVVQLVAFSATAIFLIFLFRKKFTPIAIVLISLSPVIGTIITALIGWASTSRLFAGIVISLGTLGLFWWLGKRPFEFYQAWLSTAPWLSPEQRDHLSKQELKIAPQWPFLFTVFAIAILFPLLSPTFALFSIYVAIALQVVRFAPTDSEDTMLEKVRVFVRQLTDILAQYVTYGMRAPLAPGVWNPKHSYQLRMLVMMTLITGLYFTINVTLYLGAPWDMLQLLPESEITSEELADYRRSPVMWLDYLFQITTEWEHGHYMPWFFLLPLFVQMTLPLCILVAAFAPNVRKLKKLEGKLNDEKKEDQRSEWQWYVDRIRTSPHVAKDAMETKVRESDHLFIGIEEQFGYPVLLDRKVLSEHTYIAGETGSGKTSMGIMPMLIQLIRGSEQTNPEDGRTSRSPVPPIVILDLKGDPALFHTVKAEAEFRATQDAVAGGMDPENKEGIEAVKKKAFAFFSPEKDRSSHVFNPFDNLDYGSHSIIQICNILIDSLSLNHGEGYGRGYYTAKNRLALASALASENKPTNFKELLNNVHKEVGKGGTRDLYELLAVIDALLHYPQLGTGEGVPEDQIIRMSEVIEQRRVVYFYLPAAMESISVREIAKLALFTLFTAMIKRQRSGVDGASPRQCYVFIDEFQRIAGENFKIILEQARGFGLGAVLANQCQSDLKTVSADLRPTIRTNTRTKFFFSMSDPMEIQDLTTTSGQEIATLQTYASIPGTMEKGAGSSAIESLKNRITINDILAISDSPTGMIMQVSRGSGYSQFGGRPVMVRSTWPIPSEHYQYYAEQPWPKLESAPVSDKTPNQVDQEARDEVEELLSRIAKEVSGAFPDL